MMWTNVIMIIKWIRIINITQTASNIITHIYILNPYSSNLSHMHGGSIISTLKAHILW